MQDSKLAFSACLPDKLWMTADRTGSWSINTHLTTTCSNLI